MAEKQLKKLVKAEIITDNILKNELLEIEIETITLEGNLYDFENISIDFEYTSPSGKILKHPGFVYRKAFVVEDGRYFVDEESKPVWRIRISPKEVGEYFSSVVLTEKGIEVDRLNLSFSVKDGGEECGFVTVEPKFKKNFAFENGERYIPVGINVAWGDEDWKNHADSGTINLYQRIYERLHRYDANWTRLWCTPTWSIGFLNKNDKTDDFSSAQNRAAMFDDILEMHRKNGLYVTMVLFTHALFCATGQDVFWRHNAFNSINPNGYLDDPKEFFTNERCKKDAKIFIRYFIARYGYSRNIFAWELFNEVNAVRADEEAVKQWHKEMTEFIRETDAHSHLITTSASIVEYDLIYDKMFDYIALHSYFQYNNPRDIIFTAARLAAKYDRPLMMEEYGLDWRGVVYGLVHQHHKLWAGLMGRNAAVCMTWYWDFFDAYGEKIGDQDYYYRQYYAVSKFAKILPTDVLVQNWVSRLDLDCKDERVDIMGYTSDNYAYLWLYDVNYLTDESPMDEMQDIFFKLTLAEGSYCIAWYDTWKGENICNTTMEIKGSPYKIVGISSPKWRKDIAVTVTKI